MGFRCSVGDIIGVILNKGVMMQYLIQFRNRRFECNMPLKQKIDRYETLEVSLYYSLGGMNYFSGTVNPRGYKIAFKPCNVSGGTTTYTMMSADSHVDGYYIPIESANRYNKKRLFELAGKLDANVPAIAEAYELKDKAKLATLCKVGNLTLKPKTEPTAQAMTVKTSMVIMTEDIKAKLPALGSMDTVKPEDTPVVVKFFDPTGAWTWYATEGEKCGQIAEGAFSGQDDYKFFGYVKGFEGELGYFTLGELSTAKVGRAGLKGLPIERDRHFKGTLAEVMEVKP